MTHRLVVRGGLVIDTEPAPTVHRDTDVLVEDGRIVAVGPALDVRDAEVIDATDRIVLPGLVDTHRHVWQTALRGITADAGLPTYFDVVLTRLGGRYRPEDLAASTLAGALECLDAGITTVQDYAHQQRGPEHADAALDALHAAGIRAVYGCGAAPLDGGAVDPVGLRRVLDRTGGLVTAALAAVGPAFSSLDTVRSDWGLAAELGLPIVTHVSAMPAVPRPIDLLRRHGLLRPDTLYVHGNTLPDADLELIADSGAAVSTTPVVEARMEMGPPMAGRLRMAGVTTGVGVDVVTTAGGDLFAELRSILALGYQSFSAAEVLRLATLGGAEALGLADEIGSLRLGKQADLLLLRSTDLNLAGGLHDPIATVVAAAHPGNVETVLVAGRPVKRDGRVVSADGPAAVADLRRSAEHLALIGR